MFVRNVCQWCLIVSDSAVCLAKIRGKTSKQLIFKSQSLLQRGGVLAGPQRIDD